VYRQAALPVRNRIYRYLYEAKDFCSRQAVANACGISMPTLYQNLSGLMEEGLVRSSGEEQATGGRKAQGLDIVPDARIAVGIAVSEHHLRLIAMDLRLQELAYRVVPFELVAELSRADSTALARTLESFLDENGIDRQKLLGVGLTIPGIITKDRTAIFNAPTLNLKNVEMETLIHGIPYPVHVENDASASGHAECFVRGEKENLAYLSLEYGVGGAVMIAGEPYIGDDAKSGEFGHLCIEPGGLLCTCGKHGCLEPYISPRRIDATFGVSLEEFFAGVEQHNADYEALLYDMLRHLAIGINNIRMVLDCTVVLGGFLSEYLQPYLSVLRQYVLSGNPFMTDGSFVQLSVVPRHITPIGAGLPFIREFIEKV
jgi:Transcriptional regulator/sugar kinase